MAIPTQTHETNTNTNTNIPISISKPSINLHMPLSPSSMASVSQIYSTYTLPNGNNNFIDLPTSGLASYNANTSSVMENTMWGHENFIPVLDNGGLDHIVSLDFETMSSSAWLPGYAEQPGSAPDCAVPGISDCKMGFYGGGIAGYQNFGGAYPPQLSELDEECYGFVENIKPAAYPNIARENWGIQGNQIAAAEEPNIKVGRYSEEERKERILRYLKKRNQRNFNKTIKYACRKTLADRRVRVRGRFARNNELCDEEMTMKKNIENINTPKEELFSADSIQFQLKNDEEDWLQEAMASLVYLSHSSPDDI